MFDVRNAGNTLIGAYRVNIRLGIRGTIIQTTIFDLAKLVCLEREFNIQATPPVFYLFCKVPGADGD